MKIKKLRNSNYSNKPLILSVTRIKGKNMKDMAKTTLNLSKTSLVSIREILKILEIKESLLPSSLQFQFLLQIYIMVLSLKENFQSKLLVLFVKVLEPKVPKISNHVVTVLGKDFLWEISKTFMVRSFKLKRSVRYAKVQEKLLRRFVTAVEVQN